MGLVIMQLILGFDNLIFIMWGVNFNRIKSK